MTREEIKTTYRQSVQKLKELQCFGIDSREKIELLIQEIKNIQKICPHPELEEINFEGERVFECKDCHSLINEKGENLSER